MAKEDLRVTRTRKLLKDAFCEIFLKKNLEQITIKEICDKAMINRRTFYLHYDSLDDLLMDVLEDLSVEFLEYTKGYDHFKNVKRIVGDYFKFTNENPLFEKINNSSNLNYIRGQISLKVVDGVTNEFDSIKHLDSFKNELARIYLNSSTVAIYRHWAKTGKKVPMNEVVDFASKMIASGLESITK